MLRRGERPPWDCEKDIKSNGLLSAGLFCSQLDFTPPALITNAATTGRGHYWDWEYWEVGGVTITTSSTGQQESQPK